MPLPILPAPPRLDPIPFCPWRPTHKQALFLLAPEREVFFGGAAGGAKSVAALMAALQYVEHPRYAALILRRTYAELSKPGALMDIAAQWLSGTAARWDGQNHAWRFPSGAVLAFGYLESERDKYQFQGSNFHFIDFDELTEFTESQYTFLFSRLRRAEDSSIPLRMRAQSNPGGVGHEWVRQRFVDPGSCGPERLFIFSRLSDNPHLDQASYIESLMQLDPVTRARLLEGDWSARDPGQVFRREWFRLVEGIGEAIIAEVRAWDLAASLAGNWTVGVRLAKLVTGNYVVRDVRRARLLPGDRNRLILQTAQLDGPSIPIRFEQEGGSAGVDQVDDLVRMLSGYRVVAVKPTGSKLVRAGPAATSAQFGHFGLWRAPWNAAFLEELEAFTGEKKDETDDQVDALSSAFGHICTARPYVFGSRPSLTPEPPGRFEGLAPASHPSASLFDGLR